MFNEKSILTIEGRELLDEKSATLSLYDSLLDDVSHLSITNRTEKRRNMFSNRFGSVSLNKEEMLSIAKALSDEDNIEITLKHSDFNRGIGPIVRAVNGITNFNSVVRVNPKKRVERSKSELELYVYKLSKTEMNGLPEVTLGYEQLSISLDILETQDLISELTKLANKIEDKEELVALAK